MYWKYWKVLKSTVFYYIADKFSAYKSWSVLGSETGSEPSRHGMEQFGAGFLTARLKCKQLVLGVNGPAAATDLQITAKVM